MPGADIATNEVLSRLESLRQHQMDGQRSPHKPLLVLLVLGQLAAGGTSELPWSVAEQKLAALITEFGRPTRTGRAQKAAYPFTRLRADGVWILDHDVPMDRVAPLYTHDVVGRLEQTIETALRMQPELLCTVARMLVTSQFPSTVAPDVLEAVGLEPDVVLAAPDRPDVDQAAHVSRRRDPAWRAAVLQAWDRQCAFCGFDGQIGDATVGIDAAHVRWFAYGGPDALDNGLALCTLHHKLFDRGAVGLTHELDVQVSTYFTARTDAGRRVYDLHGRRLAPRPGTVPPEVEHVEWHQREVFKGDPLGV
ncbi:phosphorothioated DNA-binding restriction endonuclease [Actinopolymorpha pittospori]